MSPYSILLTALLWVYCSCSRILVIMPTPSYSHHVALFPIWKELSTKGHHITFLTTHPVNNASLTNFIEVDLSFTSEIWRKGLNNEIEIWINSTTKASIDGVYDLMLEITTATLRHPEVQRLIKDRNRKFDLVIAEAFHPVMSAFAEHFKCPFILVTSMVALNSMYTSIGNPTHPVTHPECILGTKFPLSFKERVISTLYDVYTQLSLKFIHIPKYENMVRTYFGKEFPSLSEISKRFAVFLVNSNPALSFKPEIPSVIDIGDGNHIKSQMQEELPQYLQDILDNASSGVIYFSLGSNIDTKVLNPKALKMLTETFSSLSPIQVLWKYGGDVLPDKPDNVHIFKWLPQVKILGHPNVKVFLTQGGVQSVEEAVYSLVPIIGIPIFGDQLTNLKNIVNSGMGLMVDIESVTKSHLIATIHEVIKNPKYRNRMKEIVELAQDQPMTGLEKAIWWIEYVLRHKGAKNLQSPYKNLPFYQYLLIDVWAFCFVVLSLFLLISTWLLFRIVKLMLNYRAIKVKTQ